MVQHEQNPKFLAYQCTTQWGCCLIFVCKLSLTWLHSILCYTRPSTLPSLHSLDGDSIALHRNRWTLPTSHHQHRYNLHCTMRNHSVCMVLSYSLPLCASEHFSRTQSTATTIATFNITYGQDHAQPSTMKMVPTSVTFSFYSATNWAIQCFGGNLIMLQSCRCICAGVNAGIVYTEAILNDFGHYSMTWNINCYASKLHEHNMILEWCIYTDMSYIVGGWESGNTCTTYPYHWKTIEHGQMTMDLSTIQWSQLFCSIQVHLCTVAHTYSED